MIEEGKKGTSEGVVWMCAPYSRRGGPCVRDQRRHDVIERRSRCRQSRQRLPVGPDDKL